MKDLKQPIVIFSAYQKANTDVENLTSHNEAIAFLKEYKVAYTEVDGCYKGVQEKSIMLFADDEYVAFSLAVQYNQESYLFSDADRSTFLKERPNANGTYIGTLKGVSKAEAIKQDNWSLIDNKYFITERG